MLLFFFLAQRVKFKTEALLAVGTSPLDDVMAIVKRMKNGAEMNCVVFGQAGLGPNKISRRVKMRTHF